jgi:hypothetical protein
MGQKPTPVKDGVKPVENTRGAGQEAPASVSSPASDQQTKTILSIIEKVKTAMEPRLWRLDVMPLNDDGTDKIEVLIGRVNTRDNTRTFPAVVLRLVRGGNPVRDYTLSATPIAYLLQYILEFANSKKIHYLYDFASAFKTQTRTVNAPEEGEVE